MSLFGWREKRDNKRLKRLAASRLTRLNDAEEFGRTAARGQARLAHQQARTFRILATAIDATRQAGGPADAPAMAKRLVKELEAAGFGPELEFALSRITPKAGDPA